MATLVYDARNPFRKKTLLILEALHLLLEAFIGIDLRLRGISVVRGLWPNCAMPFGGLVHCRPAKIGHLVSKLCSGERRSAANFVSRKLTTSENLAEAKSASPQNLIEERSVGPANVAEMNSADLEKFAEPKSASLENVAELEARLENFAPKNEVRPETSPNGSRHHRRMSPR
jgi:hypothetical protein